MPGDDTFLGISRSVEPSERLRGLRWDSVQYDEAQIWADLARFYDERNAHFRYGLAYTGIPVNKPESVDTWHIFLDNWAQIGLQHERRTYCQALLSA